MPQTSYLRREETNADIMALVRDGVTIKQIVRQTGHSRGLVRQVIRGQRTDVFRVRQSSLDAHLPWLDAQWESGCRKGAELWRRLRNRGFRGVAAFGESAFLVIYSLVAGITLAGVAWSYQAAPTTAPLWPVGNTLWAIVTIVMLLASVLLMSSVIRNPALPTGGAPAAVPDRARGVFTITRHPMM